MKKTCFLFFCVMMTVMKSWMWKTAKCVAQQYTGMLEELSVYDGSDEKPFYNVKIKYQDVPAPTEKKGFNPFGG